MKSKALIPLGIFVALAGLFLYVLWQMGAGKYNPRDIPSVFIGKPAPDIALPSLFNPEKIVRSSNYQGRPWLINFWGTWCPECWREHPYLLQLKAQGIPILGVDWRDDRNDAITMLRQNGNPFAEVAFDPQSEGAAMNWGVYGAPETFLIDAEGIIRVKHKGALNETAWREKFARWFEEKQ